MRLTGASDDELVVTIVKIVATEIVIGSLVLEHVVDGDDDRV